MSLGCNPNIAVSLGSIGIISKLYMNLFSTINSDLNSGGSRLDTVQCQPWLEDWFTLRDVARDREECQRDCFVY